MQGASSEVRRQWQSIREQLTADLGAATFDSWFRPVDVMGLERGVAILSVPTVFLRDWITRYYMDHLTGLWRSENPDVQSVEIRLTGRTIPPLPGTAQDAPHDAPGIRTAAPPEMAVPQALNPQPASSDAAAAHASRFADDPGSALYVAQGEDPAAGNTFESFVVGKSNELAHAAARRVAESNEVPFNPLFLHGGTGLGKTHLMHAIAWEVKRRFPSRKVLYLSAEKFMYQFVAAVRYRNTLAFKNEFRNVDVLMIDDFQYISGKNSTQEEFFHTFNALVDHNRQVIISADRSPLDLENVEERIRSRLGWGLVADIHPTDYELRLGILQTKAAQAARTYGNISVPNDVLEFLAMKVTSNVRDLEGALHRVLAHAALVGRPITVEATEEVLRPLIRANERRVTVDEIQRKVADYYSLKLTDLLSPRRSRQLARPRQVAMYLAKHLTTRSLPDIGRRFGGRDHTTVIHAVRRIEELRKSDPAMDEDVEMLRRTLET